MRAVRVAAVFADLLRPVPEPADHHEDAEQNKAHGTAFDHCSLSRASMTAPISDAYQPLELMQLYSRTWCRTPIRHTSVHCRRAGAVRWLRLTRENILGRENSRPELGNP